MPTIWFDVGSLLSEAHALTGVQRTNLLVLHELVSLANPAVRYCLYNDKDGGFREVFPFEIELIFFKYFSTPTQRRLNRRPIVRAIRDALISVAHAVWLRLPGQIQPAAKHWILATLALKNAIGMYLLGQIGGLRGRFQRARASRKESFPQPSLPASPAGPLPSPFQQNDVLLNFYLFSYPESQFDRIQELLRSKQITYIGMIFDLIPLFYREWWPYAFHGEFLSWTLFTVKASSLILAISRHTKKDAEEFIATRKLAPKPIEVVTLGSNLYRRRDDGGKNDQPSELLVPYRGCVLSVGTIEIRKNHLLLFKVWKGLMERHGRDIPMLVWAGNPGWLTSDLVQMVRNTNYLEERIVLLHGMQDHQLEELYAHCRFTMYPSLYEGWGLPVAESLAFGKYCIASNATSIPEVGGDLIDYHDPTDVAGCLELVERAILHPEYVAEKEARIRREYHPPTWHDCVRKVLDEVSTRFVQKAPAEGRAIPLR